MIKLTKQFKFEASHQLMNHDGKCARLHGHSWVGYAILSGHILQSSGAKENMLMDYSDIKKPIKVLVEDYLDHFHLNDTLNCDMPTSEYVAKWVFEKLKPELPLLEAIIIEETCTSRCQYTP